MRNERGKKTPRIVSDTVNESVGGVGRFDEEVRVVSIKDEGFSPPPPPSSAATFSFLCFSFYQVWQLHLLHFQLRL